MARARTKPTPRAAPRRRRAPALARTEILDAAERVFASSQPDRVGLKEVAREAGVSHALITHYFGTYSGLVEAALERRIRGLREVMLARLKEAGALARPGELLGILFQQLQDPVHQRLMRWLLASERPSAAHAFGLQEKGLQVVAHQVASALDARGKSAVDTIELTLLTAVAAAYGYSLAKHTLIGSLGREASADLDAAVQKTLMGMMRAYMQQELDRGL